MRTHMIQQVLSGLIFAVGVLYGTSAQAGDYDAASRECSASGADRWAANSERADANCTGIEPASPVGESHADDDWGAALGACADCVGDNADEIQITAWCFDADLGLLQVDSEWSHAQFISLSCPDDHAELWYHTVRTRF
jgi:hypothetical protein